MAEPLPAETDSPTARWAKVIDHESCIGCHACTTACKSENEVPLSVTRTYVKYVDVGIFPEARRAFQVTRCNQCADAPCTHACPTAAMYARPDGIVDFDKSICIGCKACIAACPYDAIFINPEDHSAEKCNFCAHRLDVGLEPACVVVCPTEAILVGDLDDPARGWRRWSAASRWRCAGPRRRRGPSCSTAAPTRRRSIRWRPGGPRAASSCGASSSRAATTWSPATRRRANSSAAAVLAYDVPHTAPVGLAGQPLHPDQGHRRRRLSGAAAAAAARGDRRGEPAVAVGGADRRRGCFSASPALLLIWDLEHPGRFCMIFTRPQWRSWLVRGGFIIGGYGLVLGLHFLASLLGRPERAHRWLAWPGLPLAAMTAIYTAYLFAQAKARDLWQSPLLPPHLLVQTLLAGGAALLPAALVWEPAAVGAAAAGWWPARPRSIC